MPQFLPIDLTGIGTDNFSKVQKEVENAKKRLNWIGRSDLSQTPEQSSLLTKVIDNLLRTGYGGMNVWREILLPQEGATPGVFDPWQAYKRGFSLEEKVLGKDVAEGLGLSTEPLFEKELLKGKLKISPSPAGIAGFVGDVLNPLDAINWLTFGLGKPALSAGKTGAELLPHAFGDSAAQRIKELVGDEALEGLTAKNVGELVTKLTTGKKNRDKLIQEIHKGMEAARTTTRTKLPSASMNKAIVTRISFPFTNAHLAEVGIPGSRAITRVASNIGEALSKSPIGDKLGSSFSTKYVPSTVPGSVILRSITGDITPGDPRWEKAIDDILEGTDSGHITTQSGSKAYREIKEGLHRTFEMARQQEDLFLKDNVKFLFKDIKLEDRKKIMYHAATGGDVKDLPEHLQPVFKEFLNWRESIVKWYKGHGIPIRELQNYVPFIVVGGRLNKEEAKVVKAMFGSSGKDIQPSDELLSFLSESVDVHLKSRIINATTPHEVNKILGREWLTEDAALAMAMRGTKFIRAQHVWTFLKGMLQKYGIGIGDLQRISTLARSGEPLPRSLTQKELAQQLKDMGVSLDAIASRGGLPEGYGLFQIKPMSNGGLKIEPLTDPSKKGFALPEEFARAFNDYVDLYFNPQAQNAILNLFDRVTSNFRTVAYLWNWGHIPRDFFSNIVNAWLGGVRNPVAYIESMRLANPIRLDGNPNQTMFVPNPGKGIEPREFTGEELYDTARKLGVVDTGQALGETAQSVRADLGGRSALDPRKYTEGYTKLMINATRVADNHTRFAMFIDGLAKGMSPEEAAAHTKKYLFDYFDLTPFERQWMRRIIPFYTWMRKNIPLQFEELFKQPGKFATFGKYHEAIEEEQDHEMVPGYLEEMAGIKLPGGELYAMPNLPYADLGRVPTDTEGFREFLSNINPILRYLPEVAANQEFFSGMALEDYEGERTHIPGLEGVMQRLFGIDLPDVVPKRTVGHLLNQIPALRNFDIMLDPENEKALARAISTIGGPAVYSADTVEKSAVYEERDRLRAIIRWLSDMGIDVPSVNDIL